MLENNLIEKFHLNDIDFYRFKEHRNDHAHYIICNECVAHNLPTCPIKEIEASIEAEGFTIKEHQRLMASANTVQQT